MAEPVDYRGARAAVRECAGNVWLTLLWDTPEEDDVAGVTRAWERAVDLGLPYRSLVDVRRVRRIDPLAFGALARHLRDRRSDFLRLLERQAIVQPDGVVGAVSAGILKLVDWQAQLSVFTDRGAAMEWLAPRDGALSDVYERWSEELASTPEIVRALRRLLGEEPVGLDVDSAARRLGRSPRTLQRELADAATSFSDELETARFELAQELLSDTDEKVETIAHRVGYRSDHFSRRFAARTGMTPARWRASRR